MVHRYSCSQILKNKHPKSGEPSSRGVGVTTGSVNFGDDEVWLPQLATYHLGTSSGLYLGWWVVGIMAVGRGIGTIFFGVGNVGNRSTSVRLQK